jgi:hypothetical protein
MKRDMSYEEAKAIVLTYLARQPPLPGDELVLVEQATRTYPFGWMFFCDSRRHVQTGELSYALAGNGPIFVSKDRGEVEELGSSKSPDTWEQILQSRYS